MFFFQNYAEGKARRLVLDHFLFSNNAYYKGKDKWYAA